MWPFRKKQLKTVEKAIEDAYKFPQPLKYVSTPCKAELYKHSIEVLYKDKRKSDKFQLEETSHDYEQTISLQPKDFTYLKNCHKDKLSSEILAKAKELYELKVKTPQVQTVDTTPYQFFTFNQTLTIPINGDFNNTRTVRSDDIKEVRIQRTLMKTIEYTWVRVVND